MRKSGNRKSGYKWKDSIRLAVCTGIGIIIARMLISDTPLGIALIIALIVGFFVYLIWGADISYRRVNWSKRESKPGTQIESRCQEGQRWQEKPK
ncbi:MAG: hypothetical protein ACYCVB_10385 [Bacilli bacterium]